MKNIGAPKNSLFLLLAFGLTTHAEETYFEGALGVSVIDHNNHFSETDLKYSPNIQFGIYKSIDENIRMGSSLEFLSADLSEADDTESDVTGKLLSWRVTEFDYKVGKNWALSFYGGFSRFYREHPSYGYGLGVGLKYALSGKWTVSSEVNWSSTDVSKRIGVVSEQTKNDFVWMSVVFKTRF